MRKELALWSGVALTIAGCNLAHDNKSLAIETIPAPAQDHTLVVETPLNNCVAEGGDSVAYGNVNYMDKSYKVWTANFERLTDHLRPNLPDNVQVLDFSTPEAGLSVPEFYNPGSLIEARCKVVVLGPWINDFGRSDSDLTVQALNNLVSTIQLTAPNTNVFIINYYSVYPRDFGSLIYPKLQPDVANQDLNAPRQTEYNNAIYTAFAGTNVKIIDVSALKPEVITDYNGFPGDGVHLSENGMRSLGGKIAGEIIPFLN